MKAYSECAAEGKLDSIELARNKLSQGVLP